MGGCCTKKDPDASPPPPLDDTATNDTKSDTATNKTANDDSWMPNCFGGEDDPEAAPAT